MKSNHIRRGAYWWILRKELYQIAMNDPNIMESPDFWLLRRDLWSLWRRIFLFVGMFLIGLSSSVALSNEMEVKNGEIYAGDWDFSDSGPLKLSGEWQVIWGKLVDPEKFENEYEGDVFYIPSRWNDVDHPSMNGAFGVATFRVKLDLPEYGQPLSFHQISPHSAWRLFANGKQISANGKVSDQPGEHRSHYTSRIFPANSGKSELVLQVSNFSHAHGGPGHPPTIWVTQTLLRTLGSLSLYYALVLGILLSIGIFHLIFYLADRNHRGHGPVHLWFSLLCFIMVFRISGVIPYFHIYFADSAYWSDLRFPYASLFAAPAVYILFFQAVFPDQFPKRPTRWIIGLNFLLMATVLLTLEGFYTHLRDFSIGMNVFVILYSIIFTVKAMFDKQSGAAIILASNTIFLATAINDAVIYTDNGTGFDLTPFGILVLGIGYSYALLLRLQTTFQNARDTSSALEELNLDLEKQVKDRTRAFKSAAAKAENSAHDQAQFIAAASHDLRQPLHALAMFNSALRHKIGDDEAARLLDKQEHSIRNMGNLLQDTLDNARIEVSQKNPVWTPLELQQAISSVATGFDIQADKRGLQFEKELTPGQIVTDGGMLQRILSNLLENALKAAENKVSIAARIQDSSWNIVVSDDGPGIAKEDIDRIFESYVSLDIPTSEKQGGYGLGLFVVKNFSRLLGGSVRLESSPGKGTKFVLTLPTAPPDHRFAEQKTEVLNEITLEPGLMIVAIDDDVEILEAMKVMLDSWGCRTEIAEDGGQALQIIKRGIEPDLVIVDYHLFGENGIDVVTRLREQIPQLPAVIITGATEPVILEKIEAHGLSFLSKPIDPGALHHFLCSRKKDQMRDQTSDALIAKAASAAGE